MLLVVVGMVAWWAFNHRTSPGDLHPSHAGVSQLKGGSGCVECHAPGAPSLSGACLACHDVIDRQLAGAAGLHGRLDPAVANACERCHREHLGDSMALVSSAAFADAGIADEKSYKHSDIANFALTGVHGELSCEKCHRSADVALLRRGERRFLGLSQDCSTCHNDVHKGDLGPDCARCHGQLRPFPEAPEFKHPDAFPLTLGHSKLECRTCHTTPNDFTGLKNDCAACHTDTYERTTKPAHASTGLSTKCAECHKTEAWTKDVSFTHPATFELKGGHEKVACAQCHAPGAFDAKLASFKSTGSCAACHASPHSTQLEANVLAMFPRGKDSCAACHSAADALFGEATPRVTLDVHAATGFPLTKPHAISECAKCHATSAYAPAATPDERRVAYAAAYPGRTPDACEACHADPHAGQFTGGVSLGKCASCHERTHFDPSAFDLTRHQNTAFPLDGAHRAVACASCHKMEDGPTNAKGEHVRRFAGTPAQCASCHDDVHKGKFDAAAAPKVVDGKQGCVRCHSTGSFADVAWSADEHKRWSGYELAGAHARAACAQCHRPAGATDAFRSAPTQCAACHKDPHAGQFAQRGTTDCAKCHKDAESFKTLAFDHQRDSRFKLDEQHAKLACGACHKAYAAGSTNVIRFKPLGVTCADCHDSRTLKGGGA